MILAAIDGLMVAKGDVYFANPCASIPLPPGDRTTSEPCGPGCYDARRDPVSAGIARRRHYLNTLL